MLINSNIRLLVVHCTDTENDKHLNAIDIHKMHLSFGWNGIGYHKIICRSGKVENGRPEYWVGAHVKGKNDISLGVCLIGRDNSLQKILKAWKIIYPQAKIVGHCDTGDTEKTCPNFDALAWSKKLNI